MQLMNRQIIHCDCDGFFAAIEIRDDDTLQGRPVAVGESPQQRGVIEACNYEARHYGIYVGMPATQALRLCPKLSLCPPRLAVYEAAGQRIQRIYADYSEQIEPVGLDGAFLDVSDTSRCRGNAALMAQEIRERIFDDVGITASAGVAPNKFLAKIASDWNKPNGIFVLLPEQIDEFVANLPVSRLPGVSGSTAKRLYQLGLRTCADLRRQPTSVLVQQFGNFGERLSEFARGLDSRRVDPHKPKKLLSQEQSFNPELNNGEQCLVQLPALVTRFEQRLKEISSDHLIARAWLRLKFHDQSLANAECAHPRPDLSTFRALCLEAFDKGKKPVRSIALGVRFGIEPIEPQPVQLALFDEPPEESPF